MNTETPIFDGEENDPCGQAFPIHKWDRQRLYRSMGFQKQKVAGVILCILLHRYGLFMKHLVLLIQYSFQTLREKTPYKAFASIHEQCLFKPHALNR